MSSDLTQKTAEGLERYLSELWSDEVRVRDLSFASAGARRRNALFRAERGAGDALELCATIIPVAAMQIMPIEVEASHIQLAERAGMPAPHIYGVTQDEQYVGGPFFVCSQLRGETIPRRILRLVREHPGLGEKVVLQMGESLARLHGVSPDEVHPETTRPAAGGDVVAIALERVATQVANMLQPSPTLTLALRWLERHRPVAPGELSVVHGDFRNGNVVVSEAGLAGVLDWEICHLGDPMEDVAWVCQRMWRFREDQLEVGGLASRALLRRGYEDAGGSWDDQTFFWWKVFGSLRWALGLHEQARAHLDGSIPNIIMAASGRRVAELEYDLLMMLRSRYRN